MTRALPLAVLLAACSGASDDESSDSLEVTIGSDGAELARTAGDIAAGGGQVPAEATYQHCVETWGGCSYCLDLDGGPTSGTLVGALDGAPCSAERTGRLGNTLTYTVSSFDLVGDYDGAVAGDYTIAATGERHAELLLERQREGRGLDATFTLDGLTATTQSYALSTIAVDATYTGFANHRWVVHFEGTATDISGTVTGDNGDTCTIDGSADDLAVICL